MTVLDKLRETMTKRSTALERAEEELAAHEAEATRRLAEIDADEVELTLTRVEADQRRAPIEHHLAGLRADVRVLRGAEPALEQRLADAEEAEHERAVAAAEDALARAVEEQRKQHATLRKSLAPAIKAAAELERHRGLVQQCYEALDELTDGATAWPADADEPALPQGAAELAKLIADGPNTPCADAEHATERAAEAQKRQDDEWLGWFRRHASNVTLAQAPARLQEQGAQVLREVEAERTASRARLQRAARAREAVRIGS